MIEVKQLTHIYKSGKGIFDVSFSVKKGEVFGFLGPNAAGKTTTIRNLMGFVNPTDGSAAIKGLDCRKHAAELQSFIGYLPGEMTFFENMSGMEFLEFLGKMRNLKDLSRRNELIERFDLDPSGGIKKMSKGMKQKVGIVAAFMHDPEVYILDEPTSGLDPFMQNVFMDLIREEKQRGKTILMSSHIFEEVQRGCDRAGIIREGRMAAIEDIKALNEMKHNAYIVELKSPAEANKLLKSGLDTEKIKDNLVLVHVINDYETFFSTLSGLKVIGLDVRRQSLEDIFMNYYGKEGPNHD
ncbi:MAG: ABC transporter ATP-binding protein [FCB group bacterium]|nr:ABC transporter ATP-binding protein [FCB group bacterium]